MTLDEILSEQIKRLPPNLRAELQSPRRDSSRSLLGGGIGLSRLESLDNVNVTPRRGYPREFAGRATNVIVEGDQAGPAPAVLPRGMDENALVRQAGFAAANSELAPLLSDWRTSPAAALTAAIGGYGRGSYAAQRDLAAGRAEAQKAEREAAQIAARDRAIADLPPEVRALAAGAPDAVFEALVKAKFPAPVKREVIGGKEQGYFSVDPNTGQAMPLIPGVTEQPKPVQVGNDLVDPVTGALVYRAPFAPTQGREPPETFQDVPPDVLKALGLPPGTQRSSRGEYKFGPASGGVGELVSVQTPEGPRYVPRAAAVGMAPADTRELAGSEGEREDKRLTGIVDKVAAAGGWEGISPEDRSWYELKYREKAAPKVALDPNTSLIVSTTPDVSFLPLPASMQPAREAPAPNPNASPPATSAPPPMVLPLPAAPGHAQAFGPGGYLDPIAPDIAGLAKRQSADPAEFGF